MNLARAIAALLAWLTLVATAGPASAQDRKPEELECAPPPDNNPATLRARAKEHYDQAQQLYLAGEYELAIPEFEIVMCLMPHPDVAYSIATCYVSLVNFERAVDWFEEAIKLQPPQAGARRKELQNRVDRLEKLPARVQVATEPPGAKVVLVSKDNLGGAEGTANAAEPIKVQAGDYDMTITLDGYEPEKAVVNLRIGQPYTYSFQLTQLKGSVRVTTEPPDARIFVDEKLVGAGSYIDALPLGEHTVTVEAEGRKPITQSLEVKPKGVAALHVKLEAPPRSGRWELIAASTTFGAAAGGVLGTTVFGQDDTSGGSVFTLGGLGVGFAGAYFGAGENIPTGTTSLIIGGGLWGATEGLALATVFTEDPDAISSSAVLGVLVGGVVSAVAAPRLELTAGDAAMVNSGAMWGTTTAVMLAALFDTDAGSTRFGAFLLGGVNFGLLAGSGLAYRHEYSRGHVALIDLSGFGGMVAGLALSGLVKSGDDATSDTDMHFMLGGMGLGLVTGSLLTRGMDAPKAPRGFAPAASLAQPMVGATVDSGGGVVTTYGFGGTF